MGDDLVSTKPVFFAANHRRWRMFAGLLLVVSLFFISLAGLAVVSLMSDKREAPLSLATVFADSGLPVYSHRKKVTVKKPLALLITGGPDAASTPAILEVLAREQVHATFFPVGHQAVQESGLMKQIFEGGHEIGDSGAQLAPDDQNNLRLQLEQRSARRVLEAVTDHSTVLQMTSLALSPDSEKLSQPGQYPQFATTMSPIAKVPLAPSSSREEQRPAHVGVPTPLALPSQSRDAYVLVLHDEPGENLAAALPAIIRDIQQNGYTFTTMSLLLGKHREDLMPRLNSEADRFLAKANRLLLNMTSHSGKVLEWIFTLTAFATLGRTALVVTFSLLDYAKRRARRRRGCVANVLGKVSILVPAYNEVLNINSVVAAALESDYADLEVIVIDDGSTDATYSVVSAAYGTHPQVRILSKANGGKASALNAGLRVASGEIMVCIDGDTVITPSTITNLLREFTSEKTAAVAGCIKIAKPRNLLTRWQEVEYMIGQNLDRQALDLINGINTVPGALGAFRRRLVIEAGGYNGDTLAEDTDLTLRLQLMGYRIGYAPDAYALTEAPETVKMLFKQRFRWSYGALQTLWKHRSGFFSAVSPGLGWFTMPQVLIFQSILPFLIPVADLCLIAGLWSGTQWHVLAYGVVFLLLDLAAALIALVLAGERWRLPYLMLMLVTQRIGYRYFIFFPLLKAYLAAIKGGTVGWGHLKRLGRVARPATGG